MKVVKLSLKDDKLISKWPTSYNKFIEIMHSSNLCVIRLIDYPPVSLLKSLLPDINLLLSGLQSKARIHEQEFKVKSIQQALDQRLDDFKNNPARMIDSILKRKRTCIILDRCIDNTSPTNDLLTEVSKVKQEVARHFQQIVRTTYRETIVP